MSVGGKVEMSFSYDDVSLNSLSAELHEASRKGGANDRLDVAALRRNAGGIARPSKLHTSAAAS